RISSTPTASTTASRPSSRGPWLPVSPCRCSTWRSPTGRWSPPSSARGARVSSSRCRADVGDPVAAAALLGFVLGVQHATDPDHLVAVATIVTRERRFADGALVGVLWGIGHALTLGAAGAVIIGLGLTPAAGFATGLELLVAAMLV